MNWAGSSLNCSRPGETKVFYYIDDDDKPFLVKLPIPIEQVTLGDFKRTLNRHNYKFFFRAKDPEVGEIKEEVSDDGARVPCFQGRIVVNMVSVDASVRSDPNSQDSGSTRSSKALLASRRELEGYGRNGKRGTGFGNGGRSRGESQNFFTQPGRQRSSHTPSAMSEQTNGGFETDSMVSVQCRSSYSDSEYDGSSRVSTLTEATNLAPNRLPRKKRRKMRINAAIRGLNRASSMSSITETTMGDNIIRVSLNVEMGRFLGIRISGPSAENPVDGIFVESVIKGSVVDVDGRIQRGDAILQVNGISFTDISYEDAICILREAASKAGHIALVIGKVYHPSSPPESDFTVQDSDDNPAHKEVLQPIDPSAWVAHIEAMRFNDMSLTRDRERERHSLLDGPRNEDFYTNGTIVHRPLSTESEPVDIVRQMASRESGLDIRDRMWLKIPIPNAFMGRDLVTWLVDNVKDLKNRTEAKKYASRLLKNGYICHTVGTKDFSEKSYYTFSEIPALPEPFAAMSILNDEGDIPDTMSQLEAYRDIPDSVSQIGQSSSRSPYRPYNGFPPFHPSRPPRPPGGPSSSSKREGSNHSSGGSGYGSDRRQKSTIFEETDSQVTEIYNPTGFNRVNPSPQQGGSQYHVNGGPHFEQPFNAFF